VSRAGRTAAKERGPGSPVFDIVRAKIELPDVRPDSVHRAALVNRLRVTRSRRLVTVFGPAGYGKTTLLAQWAERDGRPFAWVSVDDRDNDAVVLLRHVAASLARTTSLDPAVFEALRGRRRSIWTMALPRLTHAVASLDTPTVIVLDNASRLSSKESLEAVASLAEHIPTGSALVLGGRSRPRIPLSGLRSEGRLVEIGPDLLAFGRREAQLVLQRAGLELSDAQLGVLLERTEGWPAGLCLVVRAVLDDDLAGSEVTGLGGDDRYLAEFFRSECLSELDSDDQAFLVRASVLDRMSGSLCDAVLGRSDSGRRLEALATANVFLVPLDRHGESYRLHGLFRDMLSRELKLREPRRVSALNRRAAEWHEKQGRPDAAIDYALAAGNLDDAARLVASCALRAFQSGGAATVERWLQAFAVPGRLQHYPSVAAAGALVHALRGRLPDAESWLAIAERGQTRDSRPLISLGRAAICREGVEEMVSDADRAVASLPLESDWRALALLVQGASYALAGDNEGAGEALAAAVDEAQRRKAGAVQIAAMSEQALVAAVSAHDEAADALALEAHELAAGRNQLGAATDALELAVATRALLRRARWEEAQVELTSLKRLVPSLRGAVPWLAVQSLLELARAEITLRDMEGARQALGAVGQILRRRPFLGLLVVQALELEHEVGAMAASYRGAESALTAAELRLLPFLTTHLSFREIGEQFFVSRNTVKTQAISIYRKLGVSSRSQAIAEALRLGLVEAPSAGVQVVSSAQDDAAA
jgi:LuxR family transcriptional regulator, maltose regulon positive regulatory protein